jgi:hypothetical protein
MAKDQFNDSAKSGDVPKLSGVPFYLDRVLMPVSVLKQTVIDVVKDLPDKENTRQYMLYMLKVLNNPEVLEADIMFIQREEENKRNLRKSTGELKSRLYLLLGLAATAAITWLLANMGTWFAG